MRSNNPVFTHTDWNMYQQPSGYAQQGYYQQAPGYAQQDYYQQPVYQQDRMTLNDVIAKTAVLLAIVVGVGVLTALAVPPNMLYSVAIVGSIATLVTAVVMIFARSLSIPLIFVYAVLEGAVVGAWSMILEYRYPGIVAPAIVATFITAAVVLAGYRYANLRVRGRLAKFVTVAIIAYAIFALINLVTVLLGVPMGFSTVGPNAGVLSWLSAGIGVVLATASLLMDFDEIEMGIRAGAPSEQSWRAAFGLLVTMIWLYTLILRILSFFREE